MTKTKICPQCHGEGERERINSFDFKTIEILKCERCNGSGKVLRKNAILEFWKLVRNFGRNK